MADGSSFAWIASNVNIINNIAASMAPVQRLVTGLAYVIGLGFAFKGISALKQFGESKAGMGGHGSMKEPLMYLFVAGILIYFPTGLDIMLATAFGDSNILEYAPSASGNSTMDALFGSASSLGQSLVIIIRTIGIIAFVRGWVLVVRSTNSQQPGNLGKGVIHIFGGIIAINIVLTLEIINNTLYGT